MKKRYLKKWVENTIIAIEFIMILILISDDYNIIRFIITKIIAFGIFIILGVILTKYGRYIDEEL